MITASLIKEGQNERKTFIGSARYIVCAHDYTRAKTNLDTPRCTLEYVFTCFVMGAFRNIEEVYKNTVL